ncbi:MAG: flavodoxin [Anaerotignum sp.]|nr:flavodoxin [Anaerotignum sp.]
MEKAIIIYASTHHGNTYKLVQAISEKYHIPLIDATIQQRADLSEYDLIGFASGIDFGKFYTPTIEFLKNNLPQNKKVFFLFSCAKISPQFTKSIRAEALKKEAVLMGEYGCKGYNTYGPWKLIGGMNKNHPTQAEIDGAVQFFASLYQK